MTEADSIRAKFADATNVRPETVALALGVSGKLVRAYLRMTFPRPLEAKGTTWVLTNDQTIAVVEHFLSRRAPETA